MHCLTDAVVQFCKLEIDIIVHEGHPVKEEQEVCSFIILSLLYQ